MHASAALIPALPLLGFLILFVTAERLPRLGIAAVGIGSVGVSAGLALGLAAVFAVHPRPFDVILWRWMSIDGFAPRIGLHVDALSVVMVAVITVVGFLIHLYSAEYMAHEPEGYGRYFASLNLFVAAMLVLVMAGDLLLLYLGWEGVGLCSYLLIGFWYRDPANGLAARKAFVVTRIGDTAMIVGLILLFTALGTSDIQTLMARAQARWPAGSGLAVAAAALLLGGALGKSAQLPLQVWLPDAMAGPTPVSALIHAATMVTAGVYLIARTHALYVLAPPVQEAVAAIGAATLILAGFSALNQTDLKRILAYSTISQIGYMFLALGVGAWSAAIFHFMTHAFFKALLFLSAGVVIQRLGDEHDIRRMGGLRRHLPLAFWSFLIGSASLAALPFVDAGFYSKDLILWRAWSLGTAGGHWLWVAGEAGSFLTALYIFRAVFVVFLGPTGTEPRGHSGAAVTLPLVALSVLALAGGLGRSPAFRDFLSAALPARPGAPHGSEAEMTAISAAIVLLGVFVAYVAFVKSPRALAVRLARPAAGALRRFWAAGWGFDWLYDRVLMRPFVGLAFANRADVVDAVYGRIAALGRWTNGVLSATQTGRVRWYAAGIVSGAIVVVALSVMT